jgi:predicted nucleic acid-binding protein
VTRAPVAFDASAVVRAVLGKSERALERLAAVVNGEFDGVAPDLIWLELANALVGYVRLRRLALEQGRTRAGGGRPGAGANDVIGRAFRGVVCRGFGAGLSVCDDCHVVVAEAEEAVLATAERQPVEAATSSELIA